jgi:hypothetical protein
MQTACKIKCEILNKKNNTILATGFFYSRENMLIFLKIFSTYERSRLIAELESGQMSTACENSNYIITLENKV